MNNVNITQIIRKSFHLMQIQLINRVINTIILFCESNYEYVDYNRLCVELFFY